MAPAMSVIPYILATAGHVDHGKSALVRALTGTDPDRLPEEKARGITIDLGFAHLDLPGGGDRVFRVGIVDVPGHEDFVKNMVAGVGSIDAALLVVAADDGWMPQTEEHLQILTYLGVSRGVVALTKIDLAQSEQAAREQVREKLRGSPLDNAAIVPTSVISGRGMEELRAALKAMLEQTPAQPDIGKPRLAVDRAFTLRGVGTIVTGTLTGGVLRRGQSVVVQPAGRSARVRTVQSYNHEVEQAPPGSRVALNLPDLAVGDGGQGTVGRGDVVTLAELGRANDTLDLLLEVSPRAGLGRPIKEATRVRLHHGSGNVPGVVYLSGAAALVPGRKVPAQLRLDSPVFAFAGDRFILRDWPEQQTLAGGIVLDPDAHRRGFRSESRRQFLGRRANHPNEAAAFVTSELARAGTVPRSALLVQSRFSAPAIAEAVVRLAREGTLIANGPLIADAIWWRQLREQAIHEIGAAHQAHPEQSGLRLADLRQRLAAHLSRADVFDEVVAELCRDGCVKTGETIRLANHRPALPPQLMPAGTRLRNTLADRGLDAPTRKELAPDAVGQQALRFLVQAGEAVEVGDELVLHAEHYARAVEAVREHIRRHGPGTVSELKQALNTSRRIMVPLLEKLDKEGVTLRQGDRRVLRQPISLQPPPGSAAIR